MAESVFSALKGGLGTLKSGLHSWDGGVGTRILEMTMEALVPCWVHRLRAAVVLEGLLAAGRGPVGTEAAAAAYDMGFGLGKQLPGCTGLTVCPGAALFENHTNLERGHLVPVAWKILSGRQ